MKKIFTTLLLMLIMGVTSAWADLTETVLVNENFDDGTTTLFSAVSRITVGNDNNVKFTAASNSQNGFSDAKYDFDTNGAAAVKIQFAYWMTNGTYNACFIIRDKSVAYTHTGTSKSPGTPDLTGSFFSVGRSRQSSANWFSINQGKTITASADNLGLWCQADIYIDCVNKTVDYTISKLGGDVIKSETGISYKDAGNASNVSEIDFFTYGNDELDYLDNLVITKYVDESATFHNYTINADASGVTLKKLTSGTALENTSYGVSNLPYAIMSDGVCYKLDDSDVADYAKSFTMGTTDETKTVSYTKADDITYFYEAENILSKSYEVKEGVYSSGKTAGVASGANLAMSDVKCGVYTVTVNSSVRRSGDDAFTVQVSTNNTDWTDAGTITLTDSKGGNYSAENVALTADGYIRLVEAKSQNMYHYVDYVTLYKTGEAVTTNDAGVSSYVTTSALDFTDVEGLTAYVATATTSSTITLAEATIVPAGAAVVVKGAASTPYTVPATSSATPDGYTNLFQASDGTKTAAELGNVYCLNTDGNFQKVSSTLTVPAKKAYLILPSSAKTTLTLNFGGATGINAIETVNANNGAAYNLAGQRVNANAKGLVIINGKKYINK